MNAWPCGPCPRRDRGSVNATPKSARRDSCGTHRLQPRTTVARRMDGRPLLPSIALANHTAGVLEAVAAGAPVDEVASVRAKRTCLQRARPPPSSPGFPLSRARRADRPGSGCAPARQAGDRAGRCRAARQRRFMCGADRPRRRPGRGPVPGKSRMQPRAHARAMHDLLATPTEPLVARSRRLAARGRLPWTPRLPAATWKQFACFCVTGHR